MAEEVDCAELESLQAKYEQAADEFTEATKEVRSGERMRTTNSTVLAERAEAAKTKAETARRALRNHMIEHGCC